MARRKTEQPCALHALLVEWFPRVEWSQCGNKKEYSTRTNFLDLKVGPLKVYQNTMQTIYMVARTHGGAFIEAHSENTNEKAKWQIESLLQARSEKNPN